MKTILFAVPTLLLGAGFVAYSAYSQPTVEPIQVVNEPVVETVTETFVEETVPVEPPKEELVQVVEPAPAPTPDPYCAKYASKYSQAEYDKQKKKPKKDKEQCEDENAERKSKATEGSVVRQTDCEKIQNDSEDDFSDWVEQFDSYHDRC